MLLQGQQRKDCSSRNRSADVCALTEAALICERGGAHKWSNPRPMLFLDVGIAWPGMCEAPSQRTCESLKGSSVPPLIAEARESKWPLICGNHE